MRPNLILIYLCVSLLVLKEHAIIYTPYAGKSLESGSPILPIQSSSWTATDELGRKLPDASQTGPFRKDRYVGIFYYLWHGEHDSKTIHDITKITARNPAKPSYGLAGTFHWWGEPEAGYYKADDPWVIRRNLQMLTMAGVDVLFFDVTNASTYLATIDKLCSISTSMRHQGIPTPYFCFVTHTRATETITQLFQYVYQPGKYSELWFRWQGKPLILAKSEEAANPAVKDFFTWRYSWAWTDANKSPHHWQWLDNTPQRYGWDTNPEIAEQISVAVAGHPIFNIGKSFRKGKATTLQKGKIATTTNEGLYFDEQWKRALQVDPKVVFVTGWNEWIAQRFVTTQNNETSFLGSNLPAGQTYFVDLYNREYNRDIEPMKGGYTDNYYYQLVSNIRRYKGIDPPEKPTPQRTITIDGKFDDWLPVKPVYIDAQGDTIHRDHMSFGNEIHYVNNTGRNDIIESRITYDRANLYAYVKTSKPLSKSKDKNWMLLFIDSDQVVKTGWLGYDYVINQTVAGQKTTISRWNGRVFQPIAAGQLKYRSNMLEILIPLTALKIDKNKIAINFHWADNIQRWYDVNEFFVNGDSAPDRRFCYVFNGR